MARTAVPRQAGPPRSRRVARRIAAVVLALAGLAGVASAAAVMLPQTRSARPFDHAVHEQVSCTACHGTGSRHGTLLVRTPEDCAACHHDAAATPRSCTSCHAAGSLPAPGHVAQRLSLVVWPEARVRELPFGHERHADVACAECHRTPPLLGADVTCGACHEAHHRAEAACATCHAPPQQPVHDAAVHLTCAGAGCHTGRDAPAPALSRTLCLMCHVEQEAHEPAGECASCHLIPGAKRQPREVGS
jgi:hypothetical protein